MLEKMLALQNKRKKEGGFTLVELIVVLVILAILAALLIPALTGYIDKAHEKQIIAETRQCVMAAQTIYDENYGNGKELSDTMANGTHWDDSWTDEVKTLAEVTGTIKAVTVSSNKIATLVYQQNGKSLFCKYQQSDGTYNVTKTDPTSK